MEVPPSRAAATPRAESNTERRSRGAKRPSFALALPSINGRARGMPGAGRTHGPPAEKNAGGRNHRFSRNDPAFPAQWFSRLLRALPGAPGFLVTVVSVTRERHRQLDTGIGVSGPRDLTVRAGVVRPRE